MAAIPHRFLLRATWLATRISASFSSRIAEPFAGRLWFTPWPTPHTDRSRQREAAWLAGTVPLTLEIDGRRLRAFAAGQGPVVLLVHGWGDSAARLGGFVAPLTARGFRVVGFDLPGHGSSGGGQQDLYTLASVVRGAAESVGAVAVVAHSLGGAMTVLALREGLELEGVVLLAPAVRLEHGVAAFTDLLRLPPAAHTAVRRAIERRFGEAVWDDLRGDVTARTLRVPALVVHDRDDQQVAVADGITLAASWPGAELSITEGLGHSRILRDPAVAANASAFLSRALSRSSSRAGTGQAA